MGVTELMLQALGAKIKGVFSRSYCCYAVAYCATKLRATCSPMIGQFVDTMILASTDRVVIMTHHTVSLGKYWKLFSAIRRRKLSIKIPAN